MAKVNISRTFGPIHFEDLEPHRFEDLVRELLYDYKDWKSIEATGRSGSDDGFDIRAYEKNYTEKFVSENEEDAIISHPMEGNLWMIQCKREQEIGPTKIAKIIKEGLDTNNLPYGYILVASANFSKKSYDKFREELRKRGVMEFYLWGKAELEDMLYMQKYDRILFTFFGISLLTKKRNIITEIRSIVTIKNKIYKILGDNPSFQKVFLRDLKDENYPSTKEYCDFNENPRWGVFNFIQYSIKGFWVEINSYHAYFDVISKEWDYAKALELSFLGNDDYGNEDRNEKIKLNQQIYRFCESFPEGKKAKLYICGFVQFEDIALIDEKGDIINKDPHIYIDRINGKGFFARTTLVIEHLGEKYQVDQPDFNKIVLFPEVLPALEKGKCHKDQKIVLATNSYKAFTNNQCKAVYTLEDKFSFLQPGDSIEIVSSEHDDKKCLMRFGTKYLTTLDNYLKTNSRGYRMEYLINEQLGTNPSSDDNIFVYEFEYEFQDI